MVLDGSSSSDTSKFKPDKPFRVIEMKTRKGNL